MAIIDPIIDISLLSFALTIISRILQEKLVDKKKQKFHQERTKENNKKMKELAKKNDDVSKKEMEKLQEEALESMNAIMQGNTKYMLFSMPLFLVFFAVIGGMYNGVTIKLPFPLPLIHRDWRFEISNTMSWLWWYIYSGIISSIILNFIISAWEKTKKSEKK